MIDAKITDRDLLDAYRIDAEYAKWVLSECDDEEILYLILDEGE